jgi:isopenicillin N synthase-like dioxygenase
MSNPKIDFEFDDFAESILAEEAVQAWIENGYFLLKVPPQGQATCHQALQASAKFFKCSQTVKESFLLNNRVIHGYSPNGVESHPGLNFTPDEKEFWMATRFSETKLWPDRVLPEFREKVMSSFHWLDHLATQLLWALSPGLQLPPSFFSDTLQNNSSAIRVLHYPEGTTANPNFRTFPHEDMCLLTLFAASDLRGLEILKNGKWKALNPGHRIVVMPGKMMEFLTNGRVPASTHCVSWSQGQQARHSLVFLAIPRKSTQISPFLKDNESSLYSQTTSTELLFSALEKNNVIHKNVEDTP